ncbi:helix-turn-helix transcriptional regulator [Actinoplanes sp. N902-109]|uniref:helix-turn-helix transcriptional regulator n=1 Tax=Actinoplanes sp. (strain N902-109) TaxID=649831 RepID=UPI0003295D60|nr:helix-turn-helix transcriptional regulator [Actinoplanes sp. N902-109]AGL14278.1 erythropoiesis-stimulating protein [Actinoplanes sp. N902-109]
MTIDGVTRTPVPLGAAVPSLVRWGLSTDADLVFRTLVTFGPRTGRTLTVELGLAARRTADALAELRAADAAAATADARSASRIWVARPPATVVERLRSRRLHPVDPRAKVRSHHAVLRALRASALGSVLPLDTLPGLAGEFAIGLRYLPTREKTRQRLHDLTTGDLRSFWSMSPEQAFDAESARAASPLDHDLATRGVHCRLLRLPPADGDALDVSGHLINGTSYQSYETPDVPLKMMIIDRRAALVPADPADLERGYLEITHGGILDALTALFDHHWDSAAARHRVGVAPIELSDRERTLITLLAAGHTDHSAAQRLRVSARTVTAILRSLMDRLTVENRFQLGLALGALQVSAPPSIVNGES